MTRLSKTGQEVSPRVYKVTQGWEESLITWNNKPSAETTEVGPLLSTKDNVFSYNVTSAVNNWLFTSEAEYGFLVKSFDETVNAMNYFYSSRIGSNPPQLEVEWTAPYFASYSADFPTVMLTGQTITLPISVSNGGNNTWSASGSNPVKISYHWENLDGTPVTHTPLETSLPYDIKNSEAILLQAQIQAPSAAGKYKLKIDAKEGSTWFSNQNVPTGDAYITVVDNFSGLGLEKFWQYEQDIFKNKINTFNGNLVVQKDLISLNGRFPIKLDLFYNSRSTFNGLFGYGWSSLLDEKLIESSQSSNGNVAYYDKDGTEHIFTKTIDNKYSAPQGVYFTLEKIDKSFKLTDLQTGNYTLFDARNSQNNLEYTISSIVSKNNNRLNFNYSGTTLQNISVEGDDTARLIKFVYSNGKISNITAPGVNDEATGQPSSMAYKFDYDANGYLTTLTEAYGSNDARITGYNYTNNRLSQITYPNQNVANYSYDSSSRVNQVSGSNIIYTNPGFDQASTPGVLPGWTTIIPTGTSLATDTDSFSGKNSLKLTKNVTTTSPLEAVSNQINVEQNSSYVLSFYGKAENLNASGLKGVNLKGYDTNGQLVVNKYVPVDSVNWSRNSIAFNSGTSIYVKIQGILDNDVTGTIWLDAFQLEKKVSSQIKSEQEWNQFDTEEFHWNAGTKQNVSTVLNPGSLVLAKVNDDIIKSKTTQIDFQNVDPNTTNTLNATPDGKIELKRKNGWWGRWWNKAVGTEQTIDTNVAPAVSVIHPTLALTDYNSGGTQGDYYNARIEGYIVPKYSEPYTLFITADDGVRVWFEGSLVIDKWLPQPATTYSWMTPQLEAGKLYKVVIEHYERSGAERLKAEWKSVSQAREVIPSTSVWSLYESSGSREQTIDISTPNDIASAIVFWNEEKPANTTTLVETNLSLDGGSTWQGWNVPTNGSIAGIGTGVNLTNAKLKTRLTLTTNDTVYSPQVFGLSVKLLAKYQSSGTWTSPVYKVAPGTSYSQGSISWDASLPAGTAIQIEYRTSQDNVTWGNWTIASNGGSIPYQGYVQYRATLTSGDPKVTPELKEVKIVYTEDNFALDNLGVTSNNNAQTFSYDNLTTTVTDPNGIVSQYEHNPFGQVTRFIDDVNGRNITTSFEYNVKFNLTKMTDANGEHKYIYDQYGNLINSVDPNGDTTVNAYDKNNNLIRSTEPFLYVNNLVLNSDFESTLQNNIDTNRPNGWWGRWWKRTSSNVSTIDLSTNPDVDQTFGTIDFSDYVVGGQSDYYNGRLEGYIVPKYSESYNLYVNSDDGLRVWFDGALVIDQWVNQSNLYTWTTPILKAGSLYKIVFEHYENTGVEKLKLEWSSASQTRKVIPQEQVYNAKYLTDVFTRSSIAYGSDNTKVKKDQPRFSGNLALGGAISKSDNTSVEPSAPNTQFISDGDITSANYVGYAPSTNGQPVYVQVDLGSVKTLSKVAVWHYYGDGRTYHNTKTEVSEDGVNWFTVFDSSLSGEYMETGAGKVTVLSSARNARYIRDYAKGSTLNDSSHWVDIQAFDAFGQALLIEENTTNKTSTEGSGASTDWIKWSHWGNRSYWSSESQTLDPVLGNVYAGVNANGTTTYLFDYFPYSVSSGSSYTVSVMLKANQNWTGTMDGYMIRDDYATIGVAPTQTVSLTNAWQRLSFTMSANQTVSGTMGLGVKLIGLPAGVTLYAARPQLEQKAYPTSFSDPTRSDEAFSIPSTILNGSEGTIETRVYVNSTIRNTSANRYIFAYSPDPAISANTISFRHTTDNKWSTWSSDNANVASGTAVTDTLTEGWHNFAVRWSASELALFIDGQKKASVANPKLPTVSGGRLYFGKWPHTTTQYTNTLIDDIRISSRARTDAEIVAAYSSNLSLPIDSSTTYKLNLDGDLAGGSWSLDQWTLVNDFGSVSQVSLDKGVNYSGDQSLKVERLNQTNRSYAKQSVTIVPGKTYTLSGWVKTSFAGAASKGAYLLAMYKDAAGNWVELDSPFVTETKDWQRLTKTFTVPANASSTELILGLAVEQVLGSAWFDGIQLQEGTTATFNNLLTNNSFDVWNNGSITGWTQTSEVFEESLAANVKDGAKSVRINHKSTGDWRGVTSDRIPVKPGDELTISAYVKAANFIPNGNQDLLVRFFASDNTTLIAQDGPVIPAGSYDWVRIAKTVKVPLGAFYIEVSAQVKSKEISAIWLDGLQLQYGNISTNYSYDPYNNQTEAVNQQGDAITYQYDWYGNLTTKSLAISLNENLISNSNFENVSNNLPLNWQLNGTLPSGASVAAEVNEGGTFTRSSSAYGENGASLGTDTPRYYGNTLLNLHPNNINVSANSSILNGTPVTYVTDGSLDTSRYLDVESNDGQPSYLEVDLGSIRSLSKITIWHYYADSRKYHNTKTQVSTDGVNWTTIFDSAVSGEYPETAAGKTHVLPGATNVRYIRDYLNGSTANQKNHWVEIQAWDPFGQALLIEEGTTNKLNGEGTGASTDWTQWSNWGNRTYWSSESQTYDPTVGNVFAGVNARSGATYLFDYYPYSVVSGNSYTISFMLKLDQELPAGNPTMALEAYINQGSDNATLTNGSQRQSVNLTTQWQKFTFTINPGSNPSGGAGIGLRIENLPVGYTLYAARPQFEEKPFATSYTDSTRSEEIFTVPATTLSTSEGTIEARVYVNSALKNNANNRYIFSYAPSPTSSANRFGLRHLPDNQWSLWSTNADNVGAGCTAADNLSEGWHTFVARWNSTELALFIDGNKVAWVANPKMPTFASENLYWGKWALDSISNPNTLFDDVRISSRARTDAEILSGYNSNQPLPTDAYTTYKLNMDSNLAPEGKHFGKSTVKVDIPDSVTVGNYGLISDPISVIPNGTYTLSAHIKGKDLKDGSGALVKVLFYDSQDQYIGESSPKPFTGSFDWKRQYFTFTAPKDAAKVKVQTLLSAHGTAWFDGIQLEQGSTLSRYNVVPNPSMEKGSTDPKAWIKATFAGSATHSWSTDSKEGSKSLSIYSAEGLDGDWRQLFSVKPNTTYTFTGWVKTLGVEPIDAQVFGTYYLVEYNKETDNEGNIVNKHRTLGNNVGTNDWKRVTYTFTTSSSTIWLRIGASLGNWGQAKGMVWFDGVRLFEGDIIDEYLYDYQNNFPVNHIDASGNASSVTYDLLGNKLTETDSLGNTTKYAYDRFSRLIKVTDALGNTVTFTYDVNGNKTSETDALGNTTTYQYDLFDRLVRVTRPDGSFETYNYDALGNRVRSIDSLGNSYRYKYDGLNKLVSQINPLGEVTTSDYDSAGNLKTVTNARGYTTSYDYDRLNRLVQIKDPLLHTVNYTYDQKGNIIAKTDSKGNTINYVYDYSGKLLQEVDALGNSTSFIYNEAGQVIRKTDANGNSTDFNYDLLGRLVSETDALTDVKTYNYDSLGNLVQVTGQNGNTTIFNYDSLKRLVSSADALGYTVELTYDANGNRKTVKDARGNITTYTYDRLNRLTSVIDAKNNVITYTYDLNGNQTAITDTRGYTTSYAYDSLNRVVSVTDPLNGVTSYTYDAVGNRVSVTDPVNNTTTYIYDAANRLDKVQDPLGNFTDYDYDENGNKTQEITPNGDTIGYSYNANNWLTSVTDPLNYTESYTYDKVGNRLTTTDRRGNITNYTYDALNRLIKVSNQVTGPTGLVTVETSYTYDPVGNRLTVTDPKGYLTTYTYDKLNRLTTVKDALNGTTIYSYDGNSNRTSVTDPMGYVYSYAYDELNRLTSITDPLTWVTSYTYDANGNRLTVTDANNYTTTYTYDELNRVKTILDPEGGLTTFTYDKNGNTLTVTDGNNNTTTYTYTKLNQLQIQTSPEGAVTSYTYDKNGNRLTVTDPNNNVTTYTYNQNNQVLTVKDPLNNITTYTYDPNGNTLTVTDPLLKVTRYSYDELNRVKTVTDQLNNVTTYEYDLNSNRTAVIDAEGGRTTYTYDELNRLTGVTNQIGDTKSYEYDKNGNVTKFTDGNNEFTTYTYDQLNRQTKATYPDLTEVSYTYDKVGNRLSMTDSTGTTTYAYDKVNRLTRETNPALKQNTYTYDSAGNILQKIIDGVTQTFTYNKDNRLLTVSKNGVKVVDYTYNLSGNLLEVKYDNGVTTTYTYDAADHITSVRSVNFGGTVISHITYTYDGFGRIYRTPLSRHDF